VTSINSLTFALSVTPKRSNIPQYTCIKRRSDTTLNFFLQNSQNKENPSTSTEVSIHWVTLPGIWQKSLRFYRLFTKVVMHREANTQSHLKPWRCQRYPAHPREQCYTEQSDVQYCFPVTGNESFRSLDFNEAIL
jgi:hypothetical protein